MTTDPVQRISRLEAKVDRLRRDKDELIDRLHDRESEPARGMSLRDYFAGQALLALAEHTVLAGTYDQSTAERCYAIADAMLKARQTISPTRKETP